jgi:hypothetical protein
MARQAKKYKTSVSLSRSNLRYVQAEARRRRRSISFLLQEMIDQLAEELRNGAKTNDQRAEELRNGAKTNEQQPLAD